MVNSLKIKARIVELGFTQGYVAERMGMASPTLSQKLNNIRPMSLREAEKLSEILNIDVSDFHRYFFCYQLA